MALTSHIFNGQFEITTNIPEFVSYLHYDNKMAVVDRFNIKSLDGKTHTDVSMTVRLTSTETDFAEVLVLQFPEVTPGGADEAVNLKLIPSLFNSITANRTAELEFEVLKGDASLGNFSATTELYPLNSWKQGVGTRLDSMLIAAFSQPGDPVVSHILAKARSVKETLTRSDGSAFAATTSGYQGDAEEVLAEVRAIYEAIQSFEIEYSNPLTNFNLHGQPIRSPGEILETRAATCLDTTMLMSSCLESIGLHPVVFLVPLHAFVGVWLSDNYLRDPVIELGEIAGLLNGRIQIFETTTLCRGDIRTSFEDAKVRNLKWLNPDYVVYNEDGSVDASPRVIVDVRRSRYSDYGIHSLPSVVRNEDGTVTLVQTELPKVEFNFTGATTTPKLSLRDDASPARMKIWKSSLLDMTFNNPLLNRGRRSGSSCRLVIPNGKLGEVEDLLQQQNSKLALVPLIKQMPDGNLYSFDIPKFGALKEEDNKIVTERLVTGNALSVPVFDQKFGTLLKKLANASKTSIQETGVNNLFMTFGSLTWDKDPESPSAGQVTSPLFLLPVTLTHLGKDNFEISLDDTSEAAPNETLALKLAEFGINVPSLSNPDTDHAGFDIPGLIAHVREQINIVHKKTNWIVDEDATIGTFDFSNFHMWKDLQDNWKVLSGAPLVKHLLETDGTNPYLDPKATNVEATPEQLDAEIARLPIASDETQVRAVLKSLTGESFIIQGPPGTGKSQTITNLLARSLQEGKRVLFMSEKPAALAVVKDRLDEIGLGDFILDLHDKGTKPANIRNQLLASMDAKPEIDKTGLDAASADYDTALRTLAKYPERVHKADEKYGESVYSARERLLEIGGTERVALDRSFVSAMPKEAFDVFLGAMRDLPQVGQVAKTYATNPWSLSNLQESEITLELKDSVKALANKIHNLAESIQGDSSLKQLMVQVENAAAVRQYVSFTNVSLPAPAELAGARAAESAMHRKRLKSELAKLENDASSNEHFSPNIASLNFADMQSKLEQAEQAKLFKGKKLTTVAEQLNNYLAKPVFKENVSFVFSSLKVLAAQALEVDALAKQALGLGDVSNFRALDIESYKSLASQIEDLESLLALTDSSVNAGAELILQLINSGKGDHLARLGEIGREFEALGVILKSTDDSQAKWRAEKTLGSRLLECASEWRDGTLDGDPKELSRWARVLDLLKPLRDLNQLEAVDQILSGKVSYSDAPRAIERTYFSLLFEKLLDDNEIANFEGTTQDSRVQQFDDAAKRLKQYNQGLVASQVVAGRKFDASSNVGVTGALRAELTKQRKQAPVRKLLRQYWPTITQVTPIVAASPDSVARFLDIETAKFDLVVFDEASQIRVATAIGALGRAPQAIIVGDSNQMPPTAMFTKADGSGELELVEEDNFGLNDQESILSMTEIAQIPSVMLSWHYRSQDEILIAFSNKYIYEGKLSSFPSPRIGQLPIEQRKLRLLDDVSNLYVSSAKRKAADAEDAEAGDELEGRFNTNLAEAKRVVAEVKKYVKAAGAKPLSLGIITMNEQQRELIERLLDALDDENIRRLRNNEIFPRDYLFVRALEKVQGDERDVILLSVGFGRTTEKGKLNLTFGPLIRANSHRRLNVAVTRARKEMAVFTSFDPSEMSLSENSSRGMKLLKKFLEFAQGSEQISVSSANASTLRDRHREDIANALEAEGIHVTQNLGLSNFRVDIAVADPRDPTRCILAIMLDSRGWKSRNSAADRELMPAAVLKANMKWPSVERIWLPMWLRDRDGEIARIKQAIEIAVTESEMKAQAKEEAASEEVAASATDAATITGLINLSDVLSTAEEKPEKSAGAPQAKASKTVTLGVNIDEIEHFKILRDQVLVPDKTYIQYLAHPKIQELLLDISGQLTTIEGPVSPTRLVQFVAKCFGLTGVKSARAEEILAAVPTRVHKRDAEGFVYPKDVAPDAYSTWAKQNPGVGRSLQDISLVEISNAMVTLCSKTAGMESPELAKQTSLAFGTGKLTKIADKRMYDAEQVGIKRGVLVNHDGIVMAAQV
jgi:superfamily I DNA and/or RNA helicase